MRVVHTYIRTSFEKQMDLLCPIASCVGSVPEYLRKHIDTYTFSKSLGARLGGGGLDLLSPPLDLHMT